jgi:hypothetical protein
MEPLVGFEPKPYQRDIRKAFESAETWGAENGVIFLSRRDLAERTANTNLMRRKSYGHSKR